MGYSHKPVRRISGLISASIAPDQSWAKARNVRGTAARGLAYERRVLKYLARQQIADGWPCQVIPQPWIRFTDAGGDGLCQSDAILVYADYALVVEIKLRQNDRAKQQLEWLYEPLVEHLFDLPTIGLEIFKYPARRKKNSWVDSPSEIAFGSRTRLYQMHLLL